MADIDLVKRLALRLVDGSGIAKLETVKLACLAVAADNERHFARRFALRGVDSYRHPQGLVLSNLYGLNRGEARRDQCPRSSAFWCRRCP